MPTDPELIKDLATFCCWIHQDEQAKLDPTNKPPFLLVRLSFMGILNRRRKADVAQPAA